MSGAFFVIILVTGCALAIRRKQKLAKQRGDGLTFEQRYVKGEPYNNTMNLKWKGPQKLGDGLTFEQRYDKGQPYNNTMNLQHDEPIKRTY